METRESVVIPYRRGLLLLVLIGLAIFLVLPVVIVVAVARRITWGDQNRQHFGDVYFRP
jgi:hypothetical protein